MFRAEYKKRPQPAERARVRFSNNNRTYYMYTPATYEKYTQELISFFNQFSDDPNFVDMFDKKKLVYGWSVKIIFRFKGRGSKPFYGLRPDIDNIFKAVTDSLMRTEANLIFDGYATDEEGNRYLDKDFQPIPKFRKKIDDCRIVHTELLKLRVDTEEEEGFTIIIRNVGEDVI